MKMIRWIAIAAAIWNSVFLAALGLWSIPRTNSGDSVLDGVLLLAACFVPLVGALWSVVKPRRGATLMFAGVGLYLGFCVVRAFEDKMKGEILSWDPRPFYVFVIPSTAIAIIILLTTRSLRCREIQAGKVGRL